MRLVGAVLVGLGLAFSFAPINAWYLAPLAVALFVWILREQRWCQALIWGFITGVVYAVITLHWLSPVGTDTVGLLSGLFGLWFALLGLGICLVSRLPFAPFWVACWWTLIEFGFSTVPLGGFSWLRLAFGQSDGIFLGPTQLVGVAGTSFAVALVGALLFRIGDWAVQFKNEYPKLKSAWLALGNAVVAVGIVAAGALVTHNPDYTEDSMTVAAVQGDVPGTGLNSLGEQAAVVRNHVAATKELAQDIAYGKVEQPDLVVWPENSTDIDPITNLGIRTQIDAAATAVKAPILVGAVRTNDTHPITLANTAILWKPGTGASDEYIKQHLVPFGEYMPFRELISRYTDRVNLVPRDFVSGNSPGVFEIDGRRVGSLICYEVLSDSVIRSTMSEDVNFLVLQANNATYIHNGPGGLTEAEQLLNIARIRAVETERSIVVATTNGITTVVDPFGRVVEQIAPFEPGYLVTQVPISGYPPVGIFVGRYIEYGLALLGLLAFVAGIVAVNRKKSD